MSPSLAAALVAIVHKAADPGISHAAARGAELGVIYGVVNVVGPDHLATLMTLSSVTSPSRALRVGALWGLGHCFGMVMVAAVFLALHRLVTVNVDKWEHYGNYFIGASMMACGLYFIACESHFVKEQADGSFAAEACACHREPSAEEKEQAAPEDAMLSCGDCEGHTPAHARLGLDLSAFRGACHRPCCDWDGAEELGGAETAPLLGPAESARREAVVKAEAEQPTWWQRMWSGRDVKGALLGVFQGLCCPLGLLGVGFLVNLPAAGLAVFLVVFPCMSAFGNALVAASWASLTAYGFGSKISPLTIYRVSCGFTFVLGASWIVCNALNILEKLDYTASLERS